LSKQGWRRNCGYSNSLKLPTHLFRWLRFAVVLLASGCASTFETVPLEQVPFAERAQRQSEENVRVTAAVLSAEESELIFSLDLYARGIQPVWLEIENNDESPIRFLPAGLDPEYFTPLEVSYVFRSRFAKAANQQLDEHFRDLSIGNRIGPGETRSGFVFSHLEHGTKIFNVDIIGQDNDLRSFTFAVPVPGLAVDITDTDWAELYEPEEVTAYERHDVREALEMLPCCVTDRSGSKEGLPINVVIVGTLDDVIYALIRADWDVTERTTSQQTKSKAIAGTDDRYRPVSIRHAFGRPQDASFRKSRHDGQPHSHLRLWLSPMTVNGVPVWVGDVGRDLPSRSKSSERMVDADDARTVLFQDILYSQALSFFAAVKRGKAAPIARSYEQLGGALFLADGFRIVLGIGSQPVAVTDAEHLHWEKLPF
jgi:hypothetical protein